MKRHSHQLPDNRADVSSVIQLAPTPNKKVEAQMILQVSLIMCCIYGVCLGYFMSFDAFLYAS